MVAMACVLVILGVLCKRIWLLFTSFVEPNVFGGGGITLGSQNVIASNGSIWSAFGTYAPTMFELAIAVGVIALGALAFAVLCRKMLTVE